MSKRGNAWLLGDERGRLINFERKSLGNWDFVFSFTSFTSRGCIWWSSVRNYISSLRNDSLPSPEVPSCLQVSDPYLPAREKPTEEMITLQLLPEVSGVQLPPMEMQFNYESQGHHLLSGKKQCVLYFLVVWGRGVVTIAMLVSPMLLVFFIAFPSLC